MISTWQEDLLSCSQGAQPERGEHSDKKMQAKNVTKTLQPASLLHIIVHLKWDRGGPLEWHNRSRPGDVY